jgi:hypothetical protein
MLPGVPPFPKMAILFPVLLQAESAPEVYQFAFAVPHVPDPSVAMLVVPAFPEASQV